MDITADMIANVSAISCTAVVQQLYGRSWQRQCHHSLQSIGRPSGIDSRHKNGLIKPTSLHLLNRDGGHAKHPLLCIVRHHCRVDKQRQRVEETGLREQLQLPSDCSGACLRLQCKH